MMNLNNKIRRLQILLIMTFVLILTMTTCDPLVTQFEPTEDATFYESREITPPPSSPPSAIKVMTWNIRFAAGRQTPWFGDSCGDRVILTEDEVYHNLEALAARINEVQPDILFIQEADIKSKRTAYVDEVSWLLNHTGLNYAAYATAWQAQYIPSDGLGRMDMGNVVFSKWPISSAERITLPQRGDQDALTRYFYLQRNMIKAKIAVPGLDKFYVLNIHVDAFSTDDTKHKHIILFKEELDKMNSEGDLFVAGGDFNLLPPGTDSTDFCDEDKCAGESFHQPGDDPFHKEGSNYTPEKTWLVDLYNAYQPDIPLAQYQSDQFHYFTHTTEREKPWDRKLDYLFTNYHWQPGSVVIHQDFIVESDHAPVSASLEVPK
jgi:endonuclease/exonuclease/phosphatase family metal-dependent hydrolase